MPKHSDEALVAYLDGELDSAERRHVEAWLEADPAVRDRLAALAQSADLVRPAYADIVNEPVPQRLIAAARGETAQAAPQEAEILVLKRQSRTAAARPVPALADRPRRRGRAVRHGVRRRGHLFRHGALQPGKPAAETRLAAVAANKCWLDNAAGYYKLAVNAGDSMLVDVPASSDTARGAAADQPEPAAEVRLARSEALGPEFRGARLVVVDGRPAAQLVYVTDNKAIGPLTLVIGASKQPDMSPTFERRQDVNLLYWRHQGRAYALVGQADIGYLWGIANDVAWQLDAI